MDLIMLILVVAIIGCLVWVITTKIPMDPMFALAIRIIVIIVMILWIIRQLNLNLPNVL